MVSVRLIGCLIIGVLLNATQSPAWAVPDRAITPLLAEKWQDSGAILLANETEQSDPVTRLLIGYVALASNHTNEAMAMFASVQDLNGLHRWREWTDQLARTNPNNRVAALLSIDAQARLGEVTDGTRAMRALLDKQPRFALAYDLAGALAILRDDAASARDAFRQATALDPRLADGWISRGSLEAIARTPLDVPQLGNVPSVEILGYFDKAMEIDPSSAPARLGRGVILYGLGRFSEAAETFADAEAVAPWLGLAAYNGVQSELTVLRQYASRVAALENSRPGTTVQMRVEQESRMLDGRARESNARLADAVARAVNPTAQFDARMLDTANESQLRALVEVYGQSTIELANAARLDANSADHFQRNTQIQKSVGALTVLNSLTDAVANLAFADYLNKIRRDFGTPEIGPELALFRVVLTSAGTALYSDDQWAGKIGVSRAKDAAILVAKGADVADVLRSAPTVGEVAILLKALRRSQYDLVTRQQDAAMIVAGAAHHNIQNARFLASLGGTANKPGGGSPNAVLAPSNYARDAGGQTALINAVAHSVRGGSVVLVPQDRTQTLLLQHELNRQGVATQTAATPQAGITLAKQTGASWVIGAPGRWADPPQVQPTRSPLKPLDVPHVWGGGNDGGQGGGAAGMPLSQPQAPQAAYGAATWSGYGHPPVPPSQGKLGGVRTFTDSMIDDGHWPVHVPLTLCLPIVLTTSVIGTPDTPSTHITE